MNQDVHVARYRPRRERSLGKFCDGSLADIYEAAGGAEAFRRISRRFHDRVEADPALRLLFPKEMGLLEERLALFLAELTGGPPGYSAERGKTSLLCRHAHLPIAPAHAQRWLEHMTASIRKEGLGDERESRLISALAALADTLVDPFVELYHVPAASLRKRLEEDRTLATTSHHGRNLICAAAMDWDVARLSLLLEFGADANAGESGEHNPLYRAANGRGREEDGVAAVKLLLRYGADVNRVTGVGGMTPLHMSARRGTTRVAEALLDAGAEIEAKDKAGETPLRRAVNCGHGAMVRLLMERGADPRSADRKGRTPIDAARSESVRRLLAQGGPRAMAEAHNRSTE
ncbi:MAG TPA: ankyrin repeat domain-containing protein [Chthonomonadales bacterium]|nr:ankyrin repeat domain-containing protein [Chthonomonadales bacterium]